MIFFNLIRIVYYNIRLELDIFLLLSRSAEIIYRILLNVPVTANFLNRLAYFIINVLPSEKEIRVQTYNKIIVILFYIYYYI